MALKTGRVLMAAAALIVVMAGLPAVADAASPWHRVTASNGANIDEVALLRTTDGTLHVAWHRQTGGNSYDMLQTPISPGGAVGAPTTIASGWASLESPALVQAPGGVMWVFFGGIRTINPGETNNDMNAASSADGGATWLLQPGDVVAPGAAAYSSPVGATVIGGPFAPYETWYGTSGVWVHAGISPATPNFDYTSLASFGCCGYDSNIAADAAGHLMVAWYSNATGHLGVYAQRVNPDGSPSGSPVNMPGTANMNVGEIGRTPLVARPGGGFYIAYATGYPALNRIRLWSVGTPGSLVIARVRSSGGEPTATVAAAPDGRLWMIWKQQIDGRPHVFADRSNKAVTRWGAVVDAGAPAGAFSSYRLDAGATGSALDLFGSFSIGPSPSVATWYRPLLPGLTLTSQRHRLHRGHRTSVVFLVTDAGDPVKGAKVTAAGVSGRTNLRGKVTLHLSANHSLRAVVTDPGYTAAGTRLKVVR